MELQISDDQQPPAHQVTQHQAMETTQVGHPPSGERTEVDSEPTDVPMEAANDDFVTARTCNVASPSISLADLPS